VKICIPVETVEGLKAKLHAHFGSAPYFLIYDTDTDSFQMLDNSDKGHTHGMCQPLKVLEGQPINAVICVGMGQRAVQKLNQAGIRAYRVKGETAFEVIDFYQQGQLEEITVDNACLDHRCE